MNPFELLKLPATASAADAASAYRRAALRAHPDKGGKAVLLHVLADARAVFDDDEKKQAALNATRPFAHGAYVIIQNLKTVKTLNGTIGTVQCWDGLRVHVDVGQSSLKALAAENLQAAAPDASSVPSAFAPKSKAPFLQPQGPDVSPLDLPAELCCERLEPEGGWGHGWRPGAWTPWSHAAAGHAVDAGPDGCVPCAGHNGKECDLWSRVSEKKRKCRSCKAKEWQDQPEQEPEVLPVRSPNSQPVDEQLIVTLCNDHEVAALYTKNDWSSTVYKSHVELFKEAHLLIRAATLQQALLAFRRQQHFETLENAISRRGQGGMCMMASTPPTYWKSIGDAIQSKWVSINLDNVGHFNYNKMQAEIVDWLQLPLYVLEDPGLATYVLQWKEHARADFHETLTLLLPPLLLHLYLSVSANYLYVYHEGGGR